MVELPFGCGRGSFQWSPERIVSECFEIDDEALLVVLARL